MPSAIPPIAKDEVRSGPSRVSAAVLRGNGRHSWSFWIPPADALAATVGYADWRAAPDGELHGGSGFEPTISSEEMSYSRTRMLEILRDGSIESGEQIMELAERYGRAVDPERE